MSAISERMADTAELLEQAIGVVFLATLLVVNLCAVALVAALTFAMIHPGNDFGRFHNWPDNGQSDIIVLPAQPF